MILEQLKELLKQCPNDEARIAILREHLQLIILDIISKRGYFKNIAFVGGTALRIIHRINRYSEDLDFSLINDDNYDFETMIAVTCKELQLRNINVDTKVKKQIGAVRSCFFRFKGLLYDLGLSPLKDQKISVKFDIDENPPLGFQTEITVITNNSSFLVSHFDLASLLAGKLHAILSRQYTKGRDYFDLLWFMTSGVEANLQLLSNALEQSTKQAVSLNSDQLREMLIERVSNADFKAIKGDLSNFIINKDELDLYQKEIFIKSIKNSFN
ncbi:MAG: nucleotidyl transferase AbiEii/AbiGii toxin family protein [Candidatus Melainabacteria bacterium]|jgi:predicted nucleotidyltransferase component of viral defense system|nr:nucleotidyl transferase AbiEii/AbiGii toxin family protein [Candidatus Melainabacteria bacterium]